jgi:hypothetical protein
MEFSNAFIINGNQILAKFMGMELQYNSSTYYYIPLDLANELFGLNYPVHTYFYTDGFATSFEWLWPCWRRLDSKLKELPPKWLVNPKTEETYENEMKRYRKSEKIREAFNLCLEIHEFLEIIGSLK